ncbi:hypothetical protein TcBrA4_0037850 [Trypanosoma cruzi]|nr:hypothetical protein TcBrA4_0037850 [Trypanosoma cruzi]
MVAAEEWLKNHGCRWSLRSCVVRVWPPDTTGIFCSNLRAKCLLLKTADLWQKENLRFSKIGVPRQICRACAVILWADERALPQVGKGFRRGPRRAVRRSEEGTAPPTQRFLFIRRTRAGLSKSGQESRRAYVRCCGSGQNVRADARNRALARLTGAGRAVCAPSFSSWKYFHYSRLTAVRKPTCQALTQFCGRDRAIVACLSAASLRGIPQCHGETAEPTVRPRSASQSGTVQIPSETSSCSASALTRSASIAERQSVAT